MRPPTLSRESLGYAGLLVVLFGYLFFARTHASHESFVMRFDQIRDWRIALGPLGALPLTGPVSTAGGTSLGPVYYWVLWLSRVTIGPFVHNLPHAGAYGISLLQGLADLVLFDTLRRRLGSIWPALGAVLFAATVSHDLGVSSTIWNPAVSVAFAKLAIAIRLRQPSSASLWWTAGGTAASWFAVQAHSAAIFVALPIVASYVIEEIAAFRLARAVQQARVVVEVIVLLQIPFVIHALTHVSQTVPTRALAGASDAVATGHVRWLASYQSMLYRVLSMLADPWRNGPWMPYLPLLLLVGSVRACRDLALASTTIGPIAAAVAGLALWQGTYDEYWYLPVVPSAALLVVLAVTWWKPRAAGIVLVVALVAAQPARLAHSLTWYRMPEYGPLVTGTQRIARQTLVLRRLQTTFPPPQLSDIGFPFEVLGGRFSDDAPFDAVIDNTGDVRFVPVR